MNCADLIKILNGDVDLIDQVNVKDIALSKDHVLITPRHVKEMLKDFLWGEISANELTKWATFICLRAEYDTVNSDIDPLNKKYAEIADFYESVWSIVNRLSTPQIDGEITEERVRQYLAELDKYKDNDMHQFFK